MHRILIVLMLLIANAAYAQQTPQRLKGTIDRVDGNLLYVKSRGEAEFTLKLTDYVRVTGVAKATLGDIRGNPHLSIAAAPPSDGVQKVIGIQIFADDCTKCPITGECPRTKIAAECPCPRTGECPQSIAIVQEFSARAGSQMLTMRYQTGEKTFSVSENTPIVWAVGGDRSDLKPGAAISGVFSKLPDGTYEAARITVGKDGITPPM